MSSTAIQGSLEDWGPLLAETTFVVVDLETTGTSPRSGAGITEIGAIKVRGGVVLGEFQSLVNPGEPIPPFISVLTGITDLMVANAPRITSVLPAFLEFCGSEETVLVAHNAPFDVGFLTAATKEMGLTFPKFKVVDTARLARQVISRDEARNCKLATLAALFRSETTPNHRALDDARATVDVLHGLIARLGNLGIRTLTDLNTFSSRVTPSQKKKKHLGEHIPPVPGVYIFQDAKGESLYVGTSRNLRNRVRSYFTAAEQRRRITEMLGYAESIKTITCATILEAQVHELRLISATKPRYNRRSRHPERVSWIRLTDELFPRLSIVRDPSTLVDDKGWCGPFSSRVEAQLTLEAIYEAIGVRQCTPRITLASQKRAHACILLDLHKCDAPCIGHTDADQYRVHTDRAIAALHLDSGIVTTTLRQRMEQLSAAERYEEAAAARDRLGAFVRGVSRGQRLRALTQIPWMIAARPRDLGGWEFALIQYGRLSSTSLAQSNATVTDAIAQVKTGRNDSEIPPGVTPWASYEESELLLRWLEQPDVRLVEIEGEWTCPIGGAGREYRELEELLYHDPVLAPSEFGNPTLESTPRNLVSRIATG